MVGDVNHWYLPSALFITVSKQSTDNHVTVHWGIHWLLTVYITVYMVTKNRQTCLDILGNLTSLDTYRLDFQQ